MAIDTILEDRFPASDPPSWTLGASAGNLSRQEQVTAPTGHPCVATGRCALWNLHHELRPVGADESITAILILTIIAKQGESNGYVNIRIET